MNRIIEIPFGAKDSELKGWEYTIPEGMEAVIENGKVIVREKESEDERMWNKILNHFDWSFKGPYLTHEECDEIKAFLEKQKEQMSIPSREMILGIWELGNIWKENPEEREGLTQLQYIQKYWNEKNDYQKEQKCVDDKSFEDWIDSWYNEHHRDGYITMDEREFKNWSRSIRNMSRQKPIEWSEEDEANINYLIDYFNSYENGQHKPMPLSTARILYYWLYNLKSKSLRSRTKQGAKAYKTY